ncbi:MAG TPA: hypothetical protein PLP51_02975 [Acholeplasmataceae bacterium]|jgi:hypothetical protein|nr:hypothetical protein [Acholeplasmataceae bacterium]HQC30681.1 hypothetical protein [Acholeplasmataceae bacterium]
MSRTEILAIIAGVLLLTLLSFYIFDKLAKNRKQREVLKKLQRIGKLEKERNTYFLLLGDIQIQIVFLSLKHDEYLTINSSTIMQIDRSKGRPLLIRYNYDYPPYKWLFVVPGLNRVKRAINESEVDFINYQTELPNFRVIKEDEVDLLIEEYL